MLSLLMANIALAGSISFESYIIKRDDTLSEIAHEHNISLMDLAKSNPSIKNLDVIFIGDEIEIPKYEIDKDEIKGDKNPKNTSNYIKTDENTSNQTNDYYEMVVEATAYTAYCEGCSGITKTGINIRENPQLKVIAVDPRVIPLNSKVWVEGYGEAIAGDIGGAIKGNKIDVFIPNLEQAYQWGRKQVKIKVYK